MTSIMLRRLLVVLVLAVPIVPGAAGAFEVQRVTDTVFALVGEMVQRSPENLANNATFGVIVTDAGLVLVDPGGTYTGARRLHEVIRREVSEQPVVLVINTGGQDHRWLGNGYWKERGARIVASTAAVADQRERVRDQLLALDALVGAAGAKGTEPVYADQTFEADLGLEIGSVHLELHHRGQAHTPGDSFVWLPDERVLFAGDIVYVERMLGVGAQSSSRTWIEVFEALARFEPDHLVPGHGHATTLERARADTYDYLVFLRAAVGDLLDQGLGMERVGDIDQMTAFGYLRVADQIAGRNAQRVYEEMEFE